MGGKIRPNIETIKTQAKMMNGLWAYKYMSEKALTGNCFQSRKDAAMYATCDDNGRLTKFYEKDPTTNTVKYSILFSYNEHGDIIQQIYDYRDDGKYEEVYDFECEYDKDGNLTSREETLQSKWRKFKKGLKKDLSFLLYGTRGHYIRKTDHKPVPD